MKRYLLIIILLLGINCFGQQLKPIVKTIKEINSISKETYRFPKVWIPNNIKATRKINNALLEFLDIENGKFKKSIFENVWHPKSDHVIWIYSDLDYKVIQNGKTLLAIDVWANFGKRNTFNLVHYLFDIKTGNRILLDTLIEQSKKIEFTKLLYAKKDSIITDFIAQIKDSLIVHQQKNDSLNIERDLYQLDGYNRCLTSGDEEDFLFKYITFYYEKGNLYFTLGSCFSYAANSYDDLGSFSFTFKKETLSYYISKYGFYVLQ
jgi:hypothetical protein